MLAGGFERSADRYHLKFIDLYNGYKRAYTFNKDCRVKARRRPPFYFKINTLFGYKDVIQSCNNGKLLLLFSFLSEVFFFLPGLSSLLGPSGFWRLALPVWVYSLECNNNNDNNLFVFIFIFYPTTKWLDKSMQGN